MLVINHVKYAFPFSIFIKPQTLIKINLFSRGKNVKCQVAVLLSALKCPAE